ncbi:IclR family transcriptional regulator [Arthrobacter sp. NPDC056886]|uniref:IclR family transcriptional regulator n=1 Tax=Arthrobacter sp. NPDC056886 TaxID=3345960 RepID=UPI003672AEC0
MIRKDEGPRVESVHRALVLLKHMAEQGSISVTEASSMLEVNPSTAQRLLMTLVGDGFAEQAAQRRYVPGPECRRAATGNAPPPLRVHVRPYLERLFARVGETSHLATLIGTDIHHLDGIEATTHALRFGLRTGVVLPAHVTSAGKAMLADLPREDIERRYRVLDDSAAAVNAGIDFPKLYRDVDQTRRQQIGMNFEESEEGVAAMAVSLGLVDGQHAALSIAMPIGRFARQDAKRLSAQLLETAAEFKKQELEGVSLG